MSLNPLGRVPTRHLASVTWVVALPFLLSAVFGCREELPSPSIPEVLNLQGMFSLNSYYSYNNWKLSPGGSRIPSSWFRTSWKVVDTGAVALGFPHVTVVVDSTFATDRHGADSLVQTEQRYFRITANGDVFEFGFIARLLERRDTTTVDPKWDKLLSSSAGLGGYWIVEVNDSTTAGSVYARVLPDLETVRDSINGVALGVLAYHVEITGTNLTLDLWVGGSPPAFLRLWDQSDVLYNRIFQELRGRRTSG